MLEKGDRGAVASSGDSHLLQLLWTALFASSTSSFLPFLKGAWSVRWGKILKFYLPVQSPCISLKRLPEALTNTNLKATVAASPVGLHMREDKVILISKTIYIRASSLTSALWMSLQGWASELQCRPSAGEHMQVPVQAMSHLSPAHGVSALPELLLSAVCSGALLYIHTQGRQGAHCTAGTHWLSPASPSHASGASGFLGEQTEEKPLWEDSAGDAFHYSGKITMLQWHSLFVAASYQPLLWSEVWPCS